MDVKQKYNQGIGGLSLLETRCRIESQRQTVGFGPSVTHGWATPAKMWKKCCYGQKNLGQYVAVCPRFQLTSHTQPTLTLSRIKCERYIFIKKRVRSFIEVVIIVDYVIRLYLYLYMNTCNRIMVIQQWHINTCGLFNAKSYLYIYILKPYDLQKILCKIFNYQYLIYWHIIN